MFCTTRFARGCVCFIVLLAAASPRAAKATPLEPGGGPPQYEDQDEYWKDVDAGWIADQLQGTVLASRTTPFRLHAVDEASGRELLADGALTQKVIRETKSGLLSFHYSFGTSDAPDPLDFDGATFSGFGGYLTDVRTAGNNHDLPLLQRTADGDTIWFRQGESFGHTVIIRTDAPDYAEGGQFTVVGDWVATAEYPSATVPAFHPVPEPAAPVLSVSAAALLLRRRCR